MEGAERVIAIEADPRCLDALAEVAAAFPGRLEIITGDALETDVASLGDPQRRIVSNLPYNIGTALLLRWLELPGAFAGLTLMFQKEVADRLLARPRSKDYGRLSVITQWLTVVKPLFDIPAAAFTPPPKVNSTVLQITPRPEPLCPAERASLERVTTAAFGQRRKMLRQSLKQIAVEPRALLAARESPRQRAPRRLTSRAFALSRGFLKHLTPAPCGIRRALARAGVKPLPQAGPLQNLLSFEARCARSSRISGFLGDLIHPQVRGRSPSLEDEVTRYATLPLADRPARAPHPLRGRGNFSRGRHHS